MTSNLGAAALLKAADAGSFDEVNDAGEEDSEEMMEAWEDAKEEVMVEVKKKFPPELINRLDDLLVFTPLKRHHLVEVVSILIKSVEHRLKDAQSTRETPLDININLEPEACDFVVDEAYDPAFGVRPLRRYIEREIVTTLARAMVKGELQTENTVNIGVSGDGEEEGLAVSIESTGGGDEKPMARL